MWLPCLQIFPKEGRFELELELVYLDEVGAYPITTSLSLP
jgi:hypothetical protein